MSNLVQTSLIQFHNKEDGYQLYEGNPQKFGVFTLEITPTPICEDAQYIYSGNDMSGSMSDPCTDGRTKMQHLHLTLHNLVSLLSDNADKINVNLEITGFDSKLAQVIDPVKIEKNPQQVTEIQAKISHLLKPRGTTNIELALKDAKRKLNAQNSALAKNFIFMTDGLITEGTQNIEFLQAALPEDSQNYFIGFGADHDFKLLQQLSTTNSGAYYYVDKIENAGLVFGEIIHSILYTAIKQVTITAINGEIYDTEANEWTTTISPRNLCGEAKKHYHVRSERPDTFELIMTGVTKEGPQTWTETTLPYLLNEDGSVETVDLRKYMYRQKTLELLAQAQIMAKNRFTREEEKKCLQNEMRAFRKQLESFAQDLKHGDEFFPDYMKQLCDDLYICESTMYSEKSLLYTTVRKCAQGNETSFNMTRVENGDIQRQYAIDDYVLSPVPLNRGCTSDTQEQIMRQTSSTQGEEED